MNELNVNILPRTQKRKCMLYLYCSRLASVESFTILSHRALLYYIYGIDVLKFGCECLCKFNFLWNLLKMWDRFVSPIKRYDAYYIGYFTYFYTLICISAHFNFLRIQIQLWCFTFVRHKNFVTYKWNNLDQTLLTSSFAFELWTFPS